MSAISKAVLGLVTAIAALAGAGAGHAADRAARFAWVSYRGTDPVPAPRAGEYRNPILAGYYPDPSIVRVGGDFYLVNSTFSWFPGIPVWHSRDLVHWRQIGNAISRPGQLDFTGRRMSEGVFAPAISHHDGRFYIVNTCIGCGGNFVVTATDPAGPWSNPVFLPSVDGIDPSLFFDDDGSAWIVNCGSPPGGAEWEGESAIWLQRFDPVTLKTMGEKRTILVGGVDNRTKPVWDEGPHLYKVGGRYLLMVAEGGTAENHSEVIFASDRLGGPYRSAPAGVNPILTQRDLPADRARPVTSSGHADLVQLADGQWWAVFLATRPYQGDLYNTGRETFLLPVTWTHGWPRILPPATPVPLTPRAPALPASPAPPQTGTFAYHDTFAGADLSPAWLLMRNPRERWWQTGPGGLRLDARAVGIGDMGQPSFLGRRQQHADATVATEVRFDPAEGAAAGIAAVQDDRHFLALGLTRADGKLVVRAWARAGEGDPAEGRVVASAPVSLAPDAPLRLAFEAKGGRYVARYAVGGRWHTLGELDGTNLSTAKAGGFTGTMIGPFARSPS